MSRQENPTPEEQDVFPRLNPARYAEQAQEQEQRYTEQAFQEEITYQFRVRLSGKIEVEDELGNRYQGRHWTSLPKQATLADCSEHRVEVSDSFKEWLDHEVFQDESVLLDDASREFEATPGVIPNLVAPSGRSPE